MGNRTRWTSRTIATAALALLGAGSALAARTGGQAADLAPASDAVARPAGVEMFGTARAQSNRGAKVPVRVFPHVIEGTTVLYDNGPIVTHPGGGSGGADVSALQTGLGMGIFGFGHALSSGFRVADDFTVTDPFGWDIDAVTFFAYQTGSSTTSTINHVNLRIWDGVPGAPGSNIIFGDTTTNVLSGSVWSNSYRTLDTDLTATNRPIMANTATVGTHLDPGTYWLDWQTGGTLASGPWIPAVTVLTQTSTGDGLQFDTANWVAATDVGPQGFPFVIEGSVAAPEISLAKTVGTDLNPMSCGTDETLSVPAGTVVQYCYTVTNTGTITLEYHTLVDDQLGTLLQDFPFTLTAGASAFLTVQQTITATVTNDATWSASVDPPPTVGSVTVALNGVSHTWPDDIDILLVGPGGENLVLMSDVGGSTDIVGINLDVDDAAATLFPDSTVIAPGSYRPTNVGLLATEFPAPAPAGPWGQPAPAGADTLTSIFGGVSASGTWSLYVADGFNADGGSISEWCVDVQPSGITACNSSGITIGPNAGPSVPYPSTLDLGAGPDASASDSVTVTALFPDVAVDPTSLTSALAPGESENQVLTIENNGDAPLDWSLTEAPALGGGGTILNQQPNQSNGIFTDASCGLCGSGAQVLAENFSLAGTTEIGQITMWTGYFSSNTPTTSDPFTVIIHNDAAGAPGAIVYSETNVASTRQTTGVVLFGVDEYLHVLTLATPVTLPAGTYWIQIFNDTGVGGSPDDFFWEVGDPDTVGNGLPGTVFSTTAPGSAWNPQPAIEFAVLLDPSPSACSNPEDVPWLGVTQTSGSTDPMSTSPVLVTFFTAGLPLGTYEAVLCLDSNDPDTSLVEVPVTLTIDTMPFIDGFETGDTSRWDTTVAN
ncbi:MAG: hypothetical protein AMXMBFR36_35010 [Acidobacteriota bacterium]